MGYIRIDRLNALDLVPADGPYLDLLHTFITLTRKFNIIYQKLNMKLKKSTMVLNDYTHLMNRLYAEGTLCLFSGAGH